MIENEKAFITFEQSIIPQTFHGFLDKFPRSKPEIFALKKGKNLGKIVSLVIH